VTILKVLETQNNLEKVGGYSKMFNKKQHSKMKKYKIIPDEPRIKIL
jgi:hypothetical protein